MARANLKRLEEGKLYYSISEVCGMTGLEQHVLRYWESEFPQLRPKKNRSGNRAYRAKEIKIIRYIKYLLYDELYTIPGAKKKMADANVADLEGQLTLLRVPASRPAPAMQPAPDSGDEGPDEEDASEPRGPEANGSGTLHPFPEAFPEGLSEARPETTPGPESAAEEGRMRGELLRLKEELQGLLGDLMASAAGATNGRRSA